MSARVLWPLFPMLMLVAVVCLAWAVLRAGRRVKEGKTRWLQNGALGCYLIAAATARAGEWGAMSIQVHRPFSLLAQLVIVVLLIRGWGKDRPLVRLNAVALAAIWADTALHYLLTR